MSLVIETVSRSTNMDKNISQSLSVVSVCVECEAKEPSVVNYEERAGAWRTEKRSTPFFSQQF